LVSSENFTQLVSMVKNPDSYSNDLCKLQTSIKETTPTDMLSKLAYADFMKSVFNITKLELSNAGEVLKKKDGILLFRLHRSESNNNFNNFLSLIKLNPNKF